MTWFQLFTHTTTSGSHVQTCPPCLFMYQLVSENENSNRWGGQVWTSPPWVVVQIKLHVMSSARPGTAQESMVWYLKIWQQGQWHSIPEDSGRVEVPHSSAKLVSFVCLRHKNTVQHKWSALGYLCHQTTVTFSRYRLWRKKKKNKEEQNWQNWWSFSRLGDAFSWLREVVQHMSTKELCTIALWSNPAQVWLLLKATDHTR